MSTFLDGFCVGVGELDFVVMASEIEGLEKGLPVLWARGPSDPVSDQHCAQMLGARL